MLARQLQQPFPHQGHREQVVPQPQYRASKLNRLHDQFVDFLHHRGTLRLISAKQVQFDVVADFCPHGLALG